MTEDEMKERTKRFALRILKLEDALPRSRSGNAIANQVVRSGTSVADNYRAMCRAKSKPDFISKAGIVEEEADESSFWLELMIEAELLKPKRVQSSLDEANEITAMLVASRKTASRAREKQIEIKIRKSKIAWDARPVSRCCLRLCIQRGCRPV